MQRKSIKLIALLVITFITLGGIGCVQAASSNIPMRIFQTWEATPEKSTCSIILPDGINIYDDENIDYDTRFDYYFPEIEENNQPIPAGYEAGAGLNVKILVTGTTDEEITATMTTPLPSGYKSAKITTHAGTEISSTCSNGNITFTGTFNKEDDGPAPDITNYQFYGWIYLNKAGEEVTTVENTDNITDDDTEDTTTSNTHKTSNNEKKLDNEPKTGEASLLPISLMSIISLAIAIITKK